MRTYLFGIALLAGLGCASGRARPAQAPAPAAAAPAPRAPATAQTHAAAESSSVDRAQYPSTYQLHPNPPVLIRNATILTAAGQEIANGSILFKDGRIVAVGATVQAPADAVVVDGTGKYVTPGLIDDHSHLGVYAAPGTQAESDGNEATNPVTAEVWAEHSFWPGGRSAILKLVPARTVQEMKFPGAHYGLKMACGENPKNVYRGRGPSTRMGNMAGYRAAFIQAEQYRRRWDKWNKDHQGDQPARDLRLESLAEVLRGNIYVQNHCYRADEMAQMMDLAREFGFHIRSFHHAVESYKIADLLARDSVSVSVWADWWGFKEEAMDGVQQNAALNQQAGGRPIIHSDSPSGIQRLNQEAGKAMYAGLRAGIAITRDQAIRWVTVKPAWALGLDSIVGTLEPGKMADVVVWSGDPFSVYSKALQVYNDGWLVYDRNDPKHQPRTDFELGQVPVPGSDR